MSDDGSAQAALDALDQALATKPRVEGHRFSAATHKLCLLRDRLAAAGRTDAAGRRRLEHVNAVISIALAGHFPLTGVPWEELDKARRWLADIAADEGRAEAR